MSVDVRSENVDDTLWIGVGNKKERLHLLSFEYSTSLEIALFQEVRASHFSQSKECAIPLGMNSNAQKFALSTKQIVFFLT
jgi:hypothetical protein